MKGTVVEFRTRSARVPTGLFPNGQVRIYIGEARNRGEVAELEARRETLKKLARRGQWDILLHIKDGKRTVEEVCRIADDTGLDALHLELADRGTAPLLAEMVGAWLEVLGETKTKETYASGMDHLLAAHPGARVDEIPKHDINALIVKMSKRYAQNSVASARTAWSAFFTWFMEEDESRANTEGRKPFLAKHPVRGALETPAIAHRVRFLSHEEYRALEVASLPQMVAQYATLAYTGLRLGEFINLPPEHVHDTHIVIAPHGEWAPKGYPRYKRGVRNVPVHQKHLRPLLEKYRKDLAGRRTFFCNPRTHEPWTRKPFRAQLARDLEAAGLVYGRDEPGGVVPHTFRHTLGSWLAQSDVQLLKIAAIMGDTVKTVVTYYAHLLPEDLDETINMALR